MLVRPFPKPGRLVRLAYRELNIAADGTPEQVQALGDLSLLPRPWDPPTCRTPQLRAELWRWLDQVAAWVNTEYVWDVGGDIPACWPRHPHLVHEIALLADQRHQAGTALASDLMEEWHRYCLPAFTERMSQRVKDHCDQGHQPWPAKGRHARYTSDASRCDRADTYSDDVRNAATNSQDHSNKTSRGIVKMTTGETIGPPGTA
jgi:hypothetical protein